MAKRMQLNDMANQLDVSASFLSGVETGRKSIPKGWAKKISDILHLTDEEELDLKKCIIAHPGLKKIEADTPEAAEMLAAFSRYQSDLDGAQLCMLTVMIEEQAKEKPK